MLITPAQNKVAKTTFQIKKSNGAPLQRYTNSIRLIQMCIHHPLQIHPPPSTTHQTSLNTTTDEIPFCPLLNTSSSRCLSIYRHLPMTWHSTSFLVMTNTPAAKILQSPSNKNPLSSRYLLVSTSISHVVNSSPTTMYTKRCRTTALTTLTTLNYASANTLRQSNKEKCTLPNSNSNIVSSTTASFSHI